MILTFGDWIFDVDTDATRKHTEKNASEHCTCGYCKNYYEAVEQVYPQLGEFLDTFGVNILGPSELMPFEPTFLLACYRVHGQIKQWGADILNVHEIPIAVEAAEDDTFFLWVGEISLPWLQEEAMEDVISPANLPEFMERMQEVWLLRHGEDPIYS